MIEQDLERFKEPQYKRKHGTGFEVSAMTGDDIADVLQLAINTARQKGVCRYENTDIGLAAFKERSLQYLEFICQQNQIADAEDARRLIPSIESWSIYLGCSRMTVLTYEKTRSEDWAAFIGWMKNCIQAVRTQLTDLGKMPVLAYIFSSVNGYQGYVNTSEVKIAPIEDKQAVLATAESPKALADRYRAALADSESKQDVETAENTLI